MSDSENIASDSPTVFEFMNQLNPKWNLDDWFAWPPDVFALTSLIFSRTGSYLLAVAPTKTWPESKTWDKDLEAYKKEWIENIVNENSHMEKLEKLKNKLRESAGRVTLRHLSALISPDTKKDLFDENEYVESKNENAYSYNQDDAWEVAKVLLELHAIADETCRGFGIPLVEHTDDNKEHDLRHKTKMVIFVANNLLSLHGTLSRLPKNIVSILPKLRTPTVGMTLRSVSHHLTSHQTEAEIRWRTMPLVNIDDNIVNILIIPWPFTIDTDRFRASTFATDRNSYENTRYFQYIGAKEEFKPDVAYDLIKNAEESIGRIHMVVLPEQALTEKQLDAFLSFLTKNQDRDKMPIVISGICGHAGDNLDEIDTGRLSNNMVYMSTFFAGKWYRMMQNKHHRWCLNQQQILQYKLGSVLTSKKLWWEATNFYMRRLSVLAANEWFTLCPLVCEDLARLDPVSELVRGIGPTLLIALLLDGPQSKARWSGRYASVMADDPGTSVLSLSALGMTKRGNDKRYKDGWKNIALWKDATHGYEEINIDYDEKIVNPSADVHVGVVLTINAGSDLDMTADGRHHENNSAIFVYQGVHQVNSIRAKGSEGVCKGSDIQDQAAFSEDNDFLEISLFTHLVDICIGLSRKSILDLNKYISGNKTGKVKNTIEKIIKYYIHPKMNIIHSKDRDSPEKLVKYTDFICDMLYKVNIDDYEKEESNYNDKYIKDLISVSGYMLFLVEENEKFRFGGLKILSYDVYGGIMTSSGDKSDSKIDGGDIYKSVGKLEKKNPQSVRILIYSALTILWAVHRRIEAKRSQGCFNKDDGILLRQIELMLSKNYDKQWLSVRNQGHQS
ncbi:hypothetical protein F8S13_19835 [Chloroflexia bacterium SDU3-3]|nr:hypothetical protein F8S13_19835 [Chloroflexia bacterium SDU3-3]